MQHRKLHPLEYLARFFDTTEINTSFYGPLKAELAKLWCRRVAAVNPDFLFTAKLYRAFTHSPIAVVGPTSAATIRPTDDDEARTREGLDVLANEGRLGALLIQFPRVVQEYFAEPRISRPPAASVHRISARGRGARLQLGQCRNPGLLLPTRMSPSATSISRCSGNRSRPPNTSPRPSPTCACTDATTISGSIPTIATTATTISTTRSELAGWKERIENVAARAQTTYVITNNHFESKAGVNALELKAMVTGKRVPAPPTLIQKYPELRRFADPAEDSGETPGPQLPLLA